MPRILQPEGDAEHRGLSIIVFEGTLKEGDDPEQYCGGGAVPVGKFSFGIYGPNQFQISDLQEYDSRDEAIQAARAMINRFVEDPVRELAFYDYGLAVRHARADHRRAKNNERVARDIAEKWGF